MKDKPTILKVCKMGEGRFIRIPIKFHKYFKIGDLVIIHNLTEMMNSKVEGK